MAERRSPLELDPETFRALGHELVDELTKLLEELRSPPSRSVVADQTPADVLAVLGDTPLPEDGSPPDEVLREATQLVVRRSLFPGHPRFWGYVIGAPAPLGVLGDLLAAGVNPNVGAWPIAPIATAIEQQTVRWMGELLGYPAGDGLLVSGGNMANFVGFLAGRRAKARRMSAQKGSTGQAPPRLLLDRDAHLDPEGGGHVRSRHERDSLDRDGRGAAHARRLAAGRDRHRPRSGRHAPSSSSALRAPSPPGRSTR